MGTIGLSHWLTDPLFRMVTCRLLMHLIDILTTNGYVPLMGGWEGVWSRGEGEEREGGGEGGGGG